MKTLFLFAAATCAALVTSGPVEAGLRDRVRARLTPSVVVKPAPVVKPVVTVTVAPAASGCQNGKCSLPSKSGYTGGWFRTIRR